MHIRSAKPEDAKTILDLQEQHYLHQWSWNPEDLVRQIQQNPDTCRLVAEHEGQVVGYAYAVPAETSGVLHVRFYAHPEHPEARFALLQAVRRTHPGKLALESTLREDYTAARQFLEDAGFQNTFQSYGAHLDLQAFDFSPFQGLEERLFIEGFEVQRGHPQPSDALFQLYMEGFEDVPQVPATRWTLQTREAFEQAYWQDRFEWFSVWYRGQIVALTLLEKDQTTVQSEITLTARKFRHRGLSTLVKAHAFQWAKTAGFVQASTGGAVVNLGMLKVNRRLGYAIEPMWVTYTRQF